MKVVSVGSVPWSREEMVQALPEFADLYARRPIRDNVYGMKSPHMFATWFALRKLAPTSIVESGVYRGQGTWLIEQACPSAQLHCIDPRPDVIEYHSSRAKYYREDFSTIDWSDLDPVSTLLFFDDHQNSYSRLRLARWYGFRHLIFEDNYPPSRGNCYSPKQVLSKATFADVSHPSWPRRLLNAITGAGTLSPDMLPQTARDYHAQLLLRNLETYYEFPPIYKQPFTRWGDAWDDVKYPTSDPLLAADNCSYPEFLDEATSYTWICFIKIKSYPNGG